MPSHKLTSISYFWDRSGIATLLYTYHCMIHRITMSIVKYAGPLRQGTSSISSPDRGRSLEAHWRQLFYTEDARIVGIVGNDEEWIDTDAVRMRGTKPNCRDREELHYVKGLRNRMNREELHYLYVKINGVRESYTT